jgi:type III pantothenate kinase
MRTPWTVGVDRLANVAGLRAAGLRSGIAVDVGTAITIDVLSAGRFEGGLILPGFELQAQALRLHTQQLPHVLVHGGAALVGRDTRSAIEAGIEHGTALGVAAVVDRLASGRNRVPVRLTGGRADLVARWGRPVWRHDPSLLVRGLCLLGARLGRAL